MPMLYGEGKKAFHRLQLEIIRTSNDQSIFAWGCNDIYVRTGSILADDPSFFRSCDTMELMNQDEFIESLRHDIPEEEELPLIGDDRFGTFPITNRGIQMTPGCSSVLMVAPTRSSKSHCHAALVHRVHRSPLFWLCGNPITIDIQGLHVIQGGVCNYVKSISDIKTHRIATPHSKSMTVQGTGEGSLTRLRVQRD